MDSSTPQTEIDHPDVYAIEVEGKLDNEWSDWFDGMEVNYLCASKTTSIVGVVQDQAALRGLLNKIWNLNLSLISVIRLPSNDDKRCKNQVTGDIPGS